MKERIKQLEGLQTLDTVIKQTGYTEQSARNLLSRIKKAGHLQKMGKLYRISQKKILPRSPGMWDIINKHSPYMKLNPWYDHQVHGTYGEEEALIDALKTESFRVILASTRLFNHITDWKKLYHLARKEDCWQKVGALYDVARMFFRVRKMPVRYRQKKKKTFLFILADYHGKDKIFKPIETYWNVGIPFRRGDFAKVTG